MTRVPSSPSILRNGRAEQVAAGVLEPRAVARGRRDVGVQVEPIQVRLARSARGDPRRVGITAELEDAPAGAGAEGDAPPHRRARPRGQRARLLGERIGHRRKPEFSDSLIYVLSDDLDLASPLLRVGDATVPVDERHRGDLGAALVEPVFVAVRGHLHREASKPA